MQLEKKFSHVLVFVALVSMSAIGANGAGLALDQESGDLQSSAMIRQKRAYPQWPHGAEQLAMYGGTLIGAAAVGAAARKICCDGTEENDSAGGGQRPAQGGTTQQPPTVQPKISRGDTASNSNQNNRNGNYGRSRK